MEGGAQEAHTEDEPAEDKRAVGWIAEREGGEGEIEEERARERERERERDREREREREKGRANTSSNVQGVIIISNKWKGKVLRLRVTPACGLETVTLAYQQQQKVQVSENNWVWRITGAKRADRRRWNDPKKHMPFSLM